MNPSDRYERANRIIRERSKEAERRAADLAIRAQAEDERIAAERQQKADYLNRYARTVLERLDRKEDQGGYSEAESVRVYSKGRFGKLRYTDDIGFNLVDTEYTYTIQGDDQIGNSKYYLLLDGTFAAGNNPHPVIPIEPFEVSTISPEIIADNPDVYDAMLESLKGLGGPLEIT